MTQDKERLVISWLHLYKTRLVYTPTIVHIDNVTIDEKSVSRGPARTMFRLLT